jgi:hypothetical protein
MSCALLIAPVATYLIRLYGNRVVLRHSLPDAVPDHRLTRFTKLATTPEPGGMFWHWHGLSFPCLGGHYSPVVRHEEERRERHCLLGMRNGRLDVLVSDGPDALQHRRGMGASCPRPRFDASQLAVCEHNPRPQLSGWKSLKRIPSPFAKAARVPAAACLGVLSVLGYIALLFSLPNFAPSIGLSARQGSIVGALHNLGMGPGRSTIVYASDIFWRINIASVFTFLCAVFSLLVWTSLVAWESCANLPSYFGQFQGPFGPRHLLCWSKLLDFAISLTDQVLCG